MDAGLDHAGIATQNVVERELAKEGKTRHDLGREAFVERVWEWKGVRAAGSSASCGASGPAWTGGERFTMDRAVPGRADLHRLFDDGLIYRGDRMINWCPRCLTALSDIEVEHSDDEGDLYSMRYGGRLRPFVVATTRPETMLGDTAVAVHPDDPRYAGLVAARSGCR